MVNNYIMLHCLFYNYNVKNYIFHLPRNYNVYYEEYLLINGY